MFFKCNVIQYTSSQTILKISDKKPYSRFMDVIFHLICLVWWMPAFGYWSTCLLISTCRSLQMPAKDHKKNNHVKQQKCWQICGSGDSYTHGEQKHTYQKDGRGRGPARGHPHDWVRKYMDNLCRCFIPPVILKGSWWMTVICCLKFLLGHYLIMCKLGHATTLWNRTK